MNTPTTIISIDFWKNYLITMRPYLLFVSGITGIVGLSFAPEIQLLETALLFLVFFFSYGFGQALTDCFQMDTDSISSPYRPLVNGDIKKTDVLTVSLFLLTLCGVVLTYFSLSNLLLALLCVLGLSTYTFFKRHWWGGPFYNGWIVAVLCILGYNSGWGDIKTNFSTQFILVIVSVLFGYANFVLVGYFKDVAADSKTGYNTLLVKFGRKKSSFVSDLIALVFVSTGITSFLLVANSNDYASLQVPAILFLIASTAVSFYTQMKLHNVTNDDNAYKAVSPSVNTYILMLISISLANKPSWFIALILFYLGFLTTIKFRPERTQI